MIEMAGEFRRRGKLVVIGGPYATLNPEDLRPQTDILVRGEIEEIAEGCSPILPPAAGRTNTTAPSPISA